MDPQGQYNQAPPQPYPAASYGQPQGAYPPPSAMLMSPPPNGYEPTQTKCPYCGADVITAVEYENGNHAIIIFVLLLVFAIWPCCLIPICSDSCKDAIHKCPACGREIVRIRR